MFDKKSFFHFQTKSIIRINGKDRFSFLQGIISNDVNNLKNKTSIYSSILTPQGRFITDFFLTNYKDYFLIEIQKEDEEEILQKFKIYKLRSEIDISLVNDVDIFLISNDLENFLKNLVKESLCFNDPRFQNLFKRFYLFSNGKINLEKKFELNKISDENYHNLRLENSIPDFTVDAIKNKSLLMEMRFDDLNGISWTKGCYMGQEITARMKHRNLMKKKLFKIEIEFNNSITEEIIFDNKVVGNITSHNKINGLAYLKLGLIDNFDKKDFLSGDSKIKIKELWWSEKN